MEYFKWKFKGNKPLEIVALGDIHFGSNECDVDALKKTIKKIKKRNAKVILTGDLIDFALKESPGASIFENNEQPMNQYYKILDLLKPIQLQIIGSVIGNHEYRLTKVSGIDISRLLAEKIGCNYGKYQMINSITVGKQKYNVFTTHGAVSAMTTEGRVNGFKKYLEQTDCDLYLVGHCHDLHDRVFFSRKIVGNKVVEIKKTLVLCGNFLKFDGGYGEMKGYPPLKLGCPLIKLYPNTHKVEVELEW